jgi:hypothetical protein
MQNNKQSKKVESERVPSQKRCFLPGNGARKIVAGAKLTREKICDVASFVPRQRRQKNSLMRAQRCQKNSWWCVIWSGVGKLQEEGMMSVVASFPFNKGYRTIRRKRVSPEVKWTNYWQGALPTSAATSHIPDFSKIWECENK